MYYKSLDKSSPFAIVKEKSFHERNSMTHLGKLIRESLRRNRLSQNELARRVGVSSSTLTRIVQGEQQTNHETVVKIAETLGEDIGAFTQAAGFTLIEATGEEDSSGIAYLVRRLKELPRELREETVDALGAQVDIIYRLHFGDAEGENVAEELFNREMRLMKFTDPDAYANVVAKIDEFRRNQQP